MNLGTQVKYNSKKKINFDTNYIAAGNNRIELSTKQCENGKNLHYKNYSVGNDILV